MIRKLSLLLAAVCLCVVANAQYCGFDKAHNQLLNTSSSFANKVQTMDNDLATLLSGNPNALIINTSNGPVYDIPVVIHVMNTGGILGSIYNPSDATLQGMITYLNQSYQATYASYPSATTGGTYFPVQFTLAKRDAFCNATSTGIDRVNASSLLNTYYGSAASSAYTNYGVRHSGTQGIGEDTLKSLANWNHHDYYNIWVVNKIDGQDGTGSGPFVAGYAYFPGAPYTLDGTIMLATTSHSGEITLPHEIGHAFSLYHVFQGDDPGNTGAATTCPTNTNCLTDGDQVCDTEPEKRSVFNCPTINSCTGVAFTNATQHNFMDYSSCQDRFTAGQKTRWLNGLLNSRPSLLSSIGAQTISTPPTASTCQPTLPFPFAAIYDAGPRETKITDASGGFNMTATSDGGYNSDGNIEYVDRSCFQRANLTAGSSYTLSVKTGPNREFVRVYIDYNNDGVFNAAATPSELVYTHNGSTGSAGSYETHTTTYTVPTTGITTCTALRMRVITDINDGTVPAPTSCSALTYGQAEDYSVLIKSAPNSVVSVNQTTGSNPSCNGSTIGFTASYTGTPTSPTVKLYVNGAQVATGTTTATYSNTTFITGDVVTAKLFFTGSCGADSIVSSSFTVTRSTNVTPSVSITVTAGSNPGCAGQPITFTAVPVNGGTAPTYQWYIAGLAVTGATGASYSTSTLPCNTTVRVQMVSNSTCATITTVNSPVITYTCGAQAISVTAGVTGGTNPTCAGRNVSFTATPVNGGSAPTYQWYINGTSVTGATGVTFTTNVLANGDSVYVIMTSNFSCAATPSAKSPAIYMTVIPTITPMVTKAITAGTNPGCIGDPLTFTASPVNAGSNPTYRWYINGVPVIIAGTNPSYTLATGGNTGDRVWVRIIASNPLTSCYTKDSAYSDTTVLDRRVRPALPVISFIGRQLISDSSNVQWYGPAGLIPTATGPIYTPTVQGDYYAVIINPLCGSGASNVLTVSPLNVGTYNMAGMQLYPNPTTGLITITWKAATTTRFTVYTATGKTLMHDVATLATRKVLDLSALPSGTYFIVMQDESGSTGTVNVTVAH